jgi:hypothetical protein
MHKVSMTVKTGKAEVPSLIAMDSQSGASKMFISTNGSFAEIAEKDGILYMKSSTEARLLGKGTIDQLKSSKALRESLGLDGYRYMHL